jgi:hypothetical protein
MHLILANELEKQITIPERIQEISAAIVSFTFIAACSMQLPKVRPTGTAFSDFESVLHC